MAASRNQEDRRRLFRSGSGLERAPDVPRVLRLRRRGRRRYDPASGRDAGFEPGPNGASSGRLVLEDLFVSCLVYRAQLQLQILLRGVWPGAAVFNLRILTPAETLLEIRRG